VLLKRRWNPSWIGRPEEGVGGAEAEMESIMEWAAGRRGQWC
jgi:hypothetical protein